MDDKMIAGLVGTAISGAGASLSVGEIQTIISTVITIVGFLISVVIPGCIKIYRKIKEVKQDGEVTKEELDDIAKDVKELGDDINDKLQK